MIRFDPSHARALQSRGNALQRKGEYGRAIEDYNQILKLNPKNAGVIFSRGIAYKNNGEFLRAFEDFKEAFRMKFRSKK